MVVCQKALSFHSPKQVPILPALIEFQIGDNPGSIRIAQGNELAFGLQANLALIKEFSFAKSNSTRILDQTADYFDLLFHRDGGDILYGQFTGHLKRVFLPEHGGRPAHGFIEQSRQYPAVGRI